MKNRIRMYALAGTAIVAIGCAAPKQYNWGNYEDSLYKLSKDPTYLDSYGKNLEVIIGKAEATGQIPPGIYAEFGYYLVVSGRPDEAISYFQKEKERWPESSVLMAKMIENAKKKSLPGSKLAAQDSKGKS